MAISVAPVRRWVLRTTCRARIVVKKASSQIRSFGGSVLPDGRRSPIYRLGLLLPTLAVSGCQASLLDPQGPVGLAEKAILIDSLAIMLAIVVPTIAAIFTFAWWYRASNARARYLPTWDFSGRIELVVWAIPIMVVILLGGVAWIGAHELDPARPLLSTPSTAPPLEIQVVSLDWKWLFIYPAQRVATVNQLVVPAGIPLHFSLSSASVMNAFFIPQLGSMIYTMNGMVTELNLHADHVGTYRGISSHYSGEGFSDMHFDVHAVSPADFSAWISQAEGARQFLDQTAYSVLAQQSINVAPATYSHVDPQLFSKIVRLEVPPGAGPPTERAGAGQSPLIRK